jgi:hypothetical protein
MLTPVRVTPIFPAIVAGTKEFIHKLRRGVFRWKVWYPMHHFRRLQQNHLLQTSSLFSMWDAVEVSIPVGEISEGHCAPLDLIPTLPTFED